MKKSSWYWCFFFATIISNRAYAEEKEIHSGKPWKKFSFGASGFIIAMDSSVRLGTKNVGIEAEVEDAWALTHPQRYFGLIQLFLFSG